MGVNVLSFPGAIPSGARTFAYASNRKRGQEKAKRWRAYGRIGIYPKTQERP